MKATIIIDVQNDFVDGALGTKEAQAMLPALIARLKAAATQGGYIACTMDTHGDDYLSTQEGERLPVPHCKEGTEGWRLAPGVEEAMPKDAHVFKKGAFGSAELANALPKDVTEAELMGICTDICVIANALTIKSIRPDIRVSVNAACCAGVTPERHATALDAMRACQIDIV